MKATLLEKTKDTAKFSVTLDTEDLKNALRDGRLSQEAVERLLRICCRKELEKLSLEAVERFEIDCGALTPEHGLTASVTVPYVPVQAVTGYKGVEIKRVTGKDARQRMQEDALDKAIERSGLSAPQILVDNELDRLVREVRHQMHYQAMAAGSGDFFLEKELEDQMDELRQQAVRQVKAELILKGIICAEGLEVTREELEAEARRIAQEQQMPFEMVESFFGADFAMLKDDLLVRKAQEFILDHAVIL